MKTAVVFVLDDVVSVVLGKLLKQVKLSEISQDHNKDFFETLFAEHQVLMVDQTAPLSRDEFYAAVASALPEEESRTEALMMGQSAPRPAPSAPPRPAAPAPVMQQRPAPKPRSDILPEEGGGIWLKSNAKSIVIIDDITTGAEIRGSGQHSAVCIPLDRALDISTLDREQVKKSAILRKLLANGTVSECSAAEARAMEQKYWAKEQHRLKVADQSLDRILVTDGRSAAEVAENMDYDPERATTVDFTKEVTGEVTEGGGEYDDLLRSMKKNREEIEAEPIAVEETRQSSILPRERPTNVDPAQKARGLRKIR